MVSSDVLGYPIKKHFWRMGLETAWKAAFGALDIGDFETFLKESADRTYADALKQIEIIGGKSESRRIQEGKEEFEKGSIEQYRAVAENLRQSGDEYHASAIDALIADLIAEQSKPRRKAPERKPKPVIQQLPFIAPEKTPTDYITKLCKQSPLSQTEKTKIINTVEVHDIEAAIKIIKECPHDTLDEFDKFELEERLRQKEMGVIPQKEMTDRQLHKILCPVMKPKEKPKIRTMRSMRKEGGEEEDEGEGEEQVPTRPRYQFNNLADANAFFKKNSASIHEIIRVGVPEWIETRKKTAIGQLSTQAVFSLGDSLSYAMVPTRKAEARSLIAMDIIHKTKWLIVEHGLDFATRDYDWQKQYNYYTSIKVDLEQFKKDVIQAIMKLDFDFRTVR